MGEKLCRFVIYPDFQGHFPSTYLLDISITFTENGSFPPQELAFDATERG
jgi:hypothetical protein